MKSIRLLIVLCAFLGLTATSANAHEGAVTPSAGKLNPTCQDDIRSVKGQGRSCHVAGGLWKVFLPHGQGYLLTHGPDLQDQFPATEPAVGTVRNPRCQSASRPNGNYGIQAVIARASDDAQTKTRDSLRTDIATMNGKLYDEARESGSLGGADYLFRCDISGLAMVTFEQLPHTRATTTFSTIVSDLRARGYNASNQKYLVYFESKPIEGVCGQGTIFDDETDGIGNLNNRGNEFAVNYNCPWSTSMHELGHNLGAVQYNAPFSTGTGHHCYEGLRRDTDIMCYNDGGDKDPGEITACGVSGSLHFDCNHNDYFDARIGAGSGGGAHTYLDTRWNIGECYVRFIINQRCVDDTGPSFSKAPTPRLLTTIGTSRIPVNLSWAATDLGGVCSYILTESRAGSSFVTVPLSSPQAISVERQMVPGDRYIWNITAIDCNSNSTTTSSSWLAGNFEESGTFSAGWTRVALSGASGGFVKTSQTAEDAATFSVTAQTIGFVGVKGPGRGQVSVYFDGSSTPYATTDTLASSLQVRQIIVKKNYTSTALRSIRVQNLGTATRPRIDYDAIVILRRL